MAEAPGHLLGQIIGNALEQSIEPLLRAVASEHGLYLDKKGPRPARSGVKLTWTDGLNNSHDLDYVLERAGSDNERGKPAAFVESAWRRYTKHSRAKAQEIQGALLPLLLHYSDVKPFAGAVVAGRWTDSALQQMRSSGFAVLHVSYDAFVAAFSTYGIDIDADESTPDDYLRAQVDAYRRLTDAERLAISSALCDIATDEYRQFEQALSGSLTRKVSRILVIPLYGERQEFNCIADALTAISDYPVDGGPRGAFVRFEIHLTYSNGDSIVANFEHKADAAEFVRSFA